MHALFYSHTQCLFPVIRTHVCCDTYTVTSEAPRRGSNVGPAVYIYWKTICRTVS